MAVPTSQLIRMGAKPPRTPDEGPEPKKFTGKWRDTCSAGLTSMMPDELSSMRNIAKFTPLIAAVIAPTSTLLDIPALSQSWYTHDGQKMKDPNGCITLSAVGLFLNLVANILLIMRFSGRSKVWRKGTSLSLIFWMGKAIIALVNVSYYGASRRNDPGWAYTEGFWCAVVSLIMSGVIASALLFHYIFAFGKVDVEDGDDLRLTGRKFLVSVTFFMFLLGIQGLAYNRMEHWAYLDAVYFSVQCALTIGYGDLTAKTAAGKTLVFPFAVLTISQLANEVSIIIDFIKNRSQAKRDRWRKKYSFTMHRQAIRDKPNATLIDEMSLIHQINYHQEAMVQLYDLVWAALSLATFWLIGGVIFKYVEGWGYGDCIYAVMVLSVTIGFGDYTPTTPAGRVIWVVYALMAVPIVTNFAVQTVTGIMYTWSEHRFMRTTFEMERDRDPELFAPHSHFILRHHEQWDTLREQFLQAGDDARAKYRQLTAGGTRKKTSKLSVRTSALDTPDSERKQNGTVLSPNSLTTSPADLMSNGIRRQPTDSGSEVASQTGQADEKLSNSAACKSGSTMSRTDTSKTDATPSSNRSGPATPSSTSASQSRKTTSKSSPWRRRKQPATEREKRDARKGKKVTEDGDPIPTEDESSDSDGPSHPVGTKQIAGAGPSVFSKVSKCKIDEHYDNAITTDVKLSGDPVIDNYRLELHLLKALVNRMTHLEAQARQMLIDTMDQCISRDLLLADRNYLDLSGVYKDEKQKADAATKEDQDARKKEMQRQAWIFGDDGTQDDDMLSRVRRYRSTFAEVLVLGSTLLKLEGDDLKRFERWRIHLKRHRRESHLNEHGQPHPKKSSKRAFAKKHFRNASNWAGGKPAPKRRAKDVSEAERGSAVPSAMPSPKPSTASRGNTPPPKPAPRKKAQRIRPTITIPKTFPIPRSNTYGGLRISPNDKGEFENEIGPHNTPGGAMSARPASRWWTGVSDHDTDSCPELQSEAESPAQSEPETNKSDAEGPSRQTSSTSVKTSDPPSPHRRHHGRQHGLGDAKEHLGLHILEKDTHKHLQKADKEAKYWTGRFAHSVEHAMEKNGFDIPDEFQRDPKKRLPAGGLGRPSAEYLRHMKGDLDELEHHHEHHHAHHEPQARDDESIECAAGQPIRDDEDEPQVDGKVSGE